MPDLDVNKPVVTPPAGPVVTSRPAFRSLVVVQKGGQRLPFFCIHGAGGGVQNFGDIARAMHPEQPFYGLQAHGIDGLTPPHKTINDMADSYLAEIREVQPVGPYLLGGYSGGGTIAFEIATQLTENGEDVGLLAFIDSYHPRTPVREVTLFTRLDRLRREGVSYLREGIERKRQSAQTARDERAIEEHLQRGEPVPEHLRERWLWNAFSRAEAQYRPRPWKGKALLFRAADVHPFFEGGGHALGWDRDIGGGVEVVIIPGDHGTLLTGANAELLTRRLNEAIDAVGQRRR